MGLEYLVGVVPSGLKLLVQRLSGPVQVELLLAYVLGRSGHWKSGRIKCCLDVNS